MKEIKLTQGYVALVDDADYDWLNQWKWHVYGRGRTKYAVRNSKRDKETGRQSAIIMHRLILGITDPKIHGDHEDGNGLNNQRHNLRESSPSQNGMNRRSNNGSVSKHKGVVLHKSGKWQAQICVEGKSIYLGLHETESLAAVAYNEAAIKYHGEFARLNTIL